MIITHNFIVDIVLAVKECETAMQFSDRIRQFIYLFYNTVQKALKILEKGFAHKGMCQCSLSRRA